MAFDLDNFDKLSQEGITSVPRLWGYRSEDDALADIKASAYFNTQIEKLKVGDFMIIHGSDGTGLVAITSVTTNVTVASVVP
jgi:hypothetical protein